MHLMCRAAGLLLLLTSTFITVVPAAAATTPSNDTIASAIAITPGYTGTVDTTSATTDDAEAALASQCTGWAPSHGVWYKYTPGNIDEFYFDGWASTYDSTNQLAAVIATGTPDALAVVGCGWPAMQIWSQAADLTYYILVYDYQAQAAPDGGQVTVILLDRSTQPQIDVTFVGGTVNHVGRALVTANVKCSSTAWSSFYYTLTQKSGKSFVSGSANPLIVCDGATHQVTATVKGDKPFVGGIVMVQGVVSGANYYFNIGYDFTQQMKLTGAKN